MSGPPLRSYTTGTASRSGSGRCATPTWSPPSPPRWRAQVLLADGHHRYAAYLHLQEKNPGTAWDRGLAMLVDQDDTPLFLGAIHRILPRTTLEEVRPRRGRRCGTWEPAAETAAISALSHDTLVLTDGEAWAPPPPRGPASPVEVLHEELLPRLPAPAGSPTTTRCTTC